MTDAEDKLKLALEEYYKATNDGAYLTDYVIGLAGIASEADMNIYDFGQSESSVHSLLGLSKMLVRRIEYDIEADMYGEEEE